MRQSIGGIWLYGLIITFVLLFVSFLTITLNYTKAFRVKNEVLSILEREEGLTSRTVTSDLGAVQLINNYLTNNGQRAMGACDDGWLGAKSLELSDSAIVLEQAVKGKKYYYCVKKFDNYSDVSTEKYRAYYKIRIFLKFELPVFADLFTFGINGETNEIRYPGDCKVWGKC